jgi:RimJ/RimL family protein N-acetyltransferase
VPNKIGLGGHVCNTGVMIGRAWRGRGYGQEMSDFGISKAKELGYRAIQLNLVVTTNTASIAINKRNGFEIVGTLKGAFFYKRERYVDAYVMYKLL